MSLLFLPLLAPVLLLAGAALGWTRPGRPSALLVSLIEACALLAVAVACASVMVLLSAGAATSPALGWGALALSVRLDVVSIGMMLLVTFIGWVVVRYARRYLDGEARQGAFMAGLCSTLASVLLLILAGNLVQLTLAWILASLCLQRLLLFYPDRPGAQRAARKKFLSARAGDVALAGAAVLLAVACRTTDIATVLDCVRSGGESQLVSGAAALLALAALLKTAQFPTHGWLTEVMEAPTPVSALLHAGVINAGGFLLVRFADVMLHAPGALAALVMIGGFTAIFGCLVMLTQPAVKTALAWSTVAQMGFMMLECGLALFPLALLHLFAHSLYKAHAFLSSGGAVEVVTAVRRPGPVAPPSLSAVARAFLFALLLYALVGSCFGFAHKSPQAIALGAILIFGVAYLIAQGLADAAPRALTLRTAIYASATAFAYFGLQAAMARLTEGVLPATPAAGPLEWVLIVLAVLSFGLVALVQTLFPLWAGHPAAAGLRVHLANGLYVNALCDRWLGSWTTRSTS